MKVLILNCGSSSIKFQFINVDKEKVLAEGIVEKIGEPSGLYTYKSEKFTVKQQEMEIKTHTIGINKILKNLMDKENGVISNPSEIDAVGHRLVHGGESYSDSVKITPEVVKVLEECSELAPLHNPANISGIEAINNNMKDIPQVGVFDTAFHQTMPERAYLYALPYEYYTDKKIRKYGFHGTSHKFVAQKAADYLNKNIKDLKIITCHIGNGASVTAIDKGKSVDTSMGFTPLEGIMMGTRCGDIDPAIIVFMEKNMGLSIDEINHIINKKSGMIGLSKVSNDMRAIEEAINNKNENAIRAFDVYCYKIKKYIGAYIATMNGIDAIIFTGGAGENMPLLRKNICSDMEYLGIDIDLEKNHKWQDGIFEINKDNSKVKLLKVQTNEELMIALETKKVLT